MKTISVRALRENPGILSRCAASGEYILVTNCSAPISLSILFDEDLIRAGVHVSVAAKLYGEGVVTLVKAAAIARMSVEAFLVKLASLGVTVVDQSPDELDADLSALDG